VTITDTLPAGATFGEVVGVGPLLSGSTEMAQSFTWYTPTLMAG